jgi:hypothetical protein
MVAVPRHGRMAQHSQNAAMNKEAKAICTIQRIQLVNSGEGWKRREAVVAAKHAGSPFLSTPQQAASQRHAITGVGRR